MSFLFPMDAILIDNVSKHFRKTTIRRHHTTLKTEVVRWLRRERKQLPPHTLIESLNSVSLRIPQGKTVGIIGRNGAGKSTLLKIITGIYSPSSGTVQVNGRISALLDLGAGFHPEFSGRENILINGIILGMSRSEIRARMQTIIDFSELGDFIDEPVRTYSSGMYMRLAFSVATHVDPDILLIDEILAVGDEHFSRKSRAKMNEFKKNGKTIVLVTHDLGTVQSWCELAAWIDEGQLRSVGSPREVVAQYRQAIDLGEARAAAGLAVSPQGSDATPSEASTAPSSDANLNGRGPVGSFLKRVEIVEHPNGSALTPESALDVLIDFENLQNLTGVGFSLRIFRSDGIQVYGTNSSIGSAPLPNPLPGCGTVRFAIERLGLGEGTYSLDVSVQDAAGRDYDSPVVRSFVVSTSTPENGILRPRHRWSLETRDAASGVYSAVDA